VQDTPRPTTSWSGTRHSFPEPIRAQILAAHPVCRACGLRPSTEADHIVPVAEGGTDAVTNGQGLCTTCHAEKTKQEQARGMQRRSLHRTPAPHPGLRR
jgi:5-methylcytosine-specific restriction endonuclease McrA